MYTDLRRYTSIPRNIKLEESSYGWYVKKICEHCLDQKLVNDLMGGIKEAIKSGYSNEDFDLFGNLLKDWHIVDALGCDDNIMLKIILSCFTKEFILEVDNRSLPTQYLEQTEIGRKLCGLSPNELSDYLSTWSDFVDLCNPDNGSMSETEIHQAFDNGNIEDWFEEVDMTSAILVIEENICDEIFSILDDMSFSEVSDGLYYFGLISYDYSDYDSLSKSAANNIIDMIDDRPIVKKLDDEVFTMLNDVVTNCNAVKLMNDLKICSSEKEVMF